MRASFTPAFSSCSFTMGSNASKGLALTVMLQKRQASRIAEGGAYLFLKLRCTILTFYDCIVKSNLIFLLYDTAGYFVSSARHDFNAFLQRFSSSGCAHSVRNGGTKADIG